MKLLISTVIGFIVLFLLGWLFYGILMMDYFAEAYVKLARAPESYRWWSLVIANLSQAFLLSYIYSRFFNKGGSPIMQGFTAGLWLGFLITIPYVFYMYATFRVYDGFSVLFDGLISGFMILTATIVIALVYGRPGPVKETVTA